MRLDSQEKELEKLARLTIGTTNLSGLWLFFPMKSDKFGTVVKVGHLGALK
jgi:hypothetical protein